MDAGRVTRKLLHWLTEHGHISTTTADNAVTQVRENLRDVPTAGRLTELLRQVADTESEIDTSSSEVEDHVEGFVVIDAVKPGEIWFDFEGVGRPAVGPIVVPHAASDLAQSGWKSVAGAARVDGRWHLLWIAEVYP